MCVYLSQLTLATVKFCACQPVYQAAATMSTVEEFVVVEVVWWSWRVMCPARAAEAKKSGVERRESILQARDTREETVKVAVAVRESCTHRPRLYYLSQVLDGLGASYTVDPVTNVSAC